MNVFGPVPSRRLGFSLGVDIIPRKCCTFDCIYCQVGKTTDKKIERRSFYSPDSIVAEVVAKLGEPGHVDVISISGSGEPTLNIDLGWIVKEIKQRTTIPVAVITNGSLLWREDVRHDLLSADIVLPSLDAAREEEFERINRPHPSILLADIIKGIQGFGRDYKGSIWLEVMLVKNVNNSLEHLKILQETILRMDVDKVHLNTVVRPPLEPMAEKIGEDDLLKIAPLFGKSCEIIAAFAKDDSVFRKDNWVVSVKEMVQRRSLSVEDVAVTTGISIEEARARLDELVRKNELREECFSDRIFYTSVLKGS
jgi:wyosine [tRNA(Phe)-imidazoG37] synthetase (radical SAM superfamily)